METFAHIISAWPSNDALADDLSVKPVVVASWKHRDSIPAEYWDDVVKAARRRRIKGVSFALLAKLASRKKTATPTPTLEVTP